MLYGENTAHQLSPPPPRGIPYKQHKVQALRAGKPDHDKATKGLLALDLEQQ